MQQKTNSSVANFLPLWPDEMTKGCTAQDFVPRGGEEEEGGGGGGGGGGEGMLD